MVLACSVVEGETVVFAPLGTNSARLVLEEGITFEITSMFAATAWTNSGVVHCLNDFLGTKFSDTTVPVERVVICFKLPDGAKRAGYLVSVPVVSVMLIRVSVLLFGSFVSNCFHTYIHRG